MKYMTVFALFGAFLMLFGCKPAKPSFAPMGDAAPVFGASGKATLKDFIVGKWCVNDPLQGLDPSHYTTSSQMGRSNAATAING